MTLQLYQGGVSNPFVISFMPGCPKFKMYKKKKTSSQSNEKSAGVSQVCLTPLLLELLVHVYS